MSVDLSATFTSPFGLQRFMSTAVGLLGHLTGSSPPQLKVLAGRTYSEGQMVNPGNPLRLSPTTMFGDIEDTSGSGSVSGQHFVVQPDGLTDNARFFILDLRNTLPKTPLTAVFSPTRTCVGVTIAAAAALAAAVEGGGGFVDDEVGLLETQVTDPQEFVRLTRQSPTDRPFIESCLSWVRQFERLKGWPYSLSMEPDS